MSLNQLSAQYCKQWLNIVVHNLEVCGTLIYNFAAGSIPVSALESTGSVGFLHDNATIIEVKDILINDLQEIGIAAGDNAFLHHNLGVVSFQPITISAIESTGSVGFLHDDGTDIEVKDILITDIQEIGLAAGDNTFLQHNAGVVSFQPVPAGSSVLVFQAYAPGTQDINATALVTRVIIDPPNINTLAAATSTNAIVVPSDGVYEASINLCLTSAFSGCYVWIDYNPGGGFGPRLAQTSTSAGLTSNQGWSQVSCLIDCVAGGLIRFTWQRNYLLSGANNFILPISHVMVKKLS